MSQRERKRMTSLGKGDDIAVGDVAGDDVARRRKRRMSWVQEMT